MEPNRHDMCLSARIQILPVPKWQWKLYCRYIYLAEMVLDYSLCVEEHHLSQWKERGGRWDDSDLTKERYGKSLFYTLHLELMFILFRMFNTRSHYLLQKICSCPMNSVRDFSLSKLMRIFSWYKLLITLMQTVGSDKCTIVS